MAMKQRPLGICDHCGGPIPPDEWYTSKGKSRLYCSRDCRNTANSRAGSPARSEKIRRRIKAGTWRNPALSDTARAKLSRPRKHSGPLAQAIEKLGRGLAMADLTPEEQAAYRQYQAELRQARRDEINAAARRRYRQKQSTLTDEEREAQRAKWRAANRRRGKRQK